MHRAIGLVATPRPALHRCLASRVAGAGLRALSRVNGRGWEARPGVPSQPLPPLNKYRCWHGAAVVSPSNTVFVMCGNGGRNTEHLEEGSSAWVNDAGLTIPTPRDLYGACAVGTTLVAVAGRTFCDGDNLDVVEAVDTATGIHKKLPRLPEKVRGCGAVSAQGKVIVVGGKTQGGTRLNSVWVLDVDNFLCQPRKRRLGWASPLPGMLQERTYHGVAVGDGCIFACGGEANNDNMIDSCEMLRLDKGTTWERLPPMPEKRKMFGCCYGGGNLFVVGGYGDHRSVFALNVGKREWTQVAELATGRDGCAAVCVGRRVLVLGGFSKIGGRSDYLSSCEAFEF